LHCGNAGNLNREVPAESAGAIPVQNEEHFADRHDANPLYFSASARFTAISMIIKGSETDE
jgi:hypothetical protein